MVPDVPTVPSFDGHTNRSPELFWALDPMQFFFDVQSFNKFIPDKNMSLVEQLNATFRFCVLFALAMLVIKHDYRAVFFAAFGAFLTYLIYTYNERENLSQKHLMEKMTVHKDKFTGYCTKPTAQNPYMNVNLTDYTDFPNRPPACNVTNPKVKKKMRQTFNDAVFRDVDDIYGKKTSDRQFYTMPVTTIPNDQKAFAEWLYVQNAPPGKQP